MYNTWIYIWTILMGFNHELRTVKQSMSCSMTASGWRHCAPFCLCLRRSAAFWHERKKNTTSFTYSAVRCWPRPEPLFPVTPRLCECSPFAVNVPCSFLIILSSHSSSQTDVVRPFWIYAVRRSVSSRRRCRSANRSDLFRVDFSPSAAAHGRNNFFSVVRAALLRAS